MIRFAKRRLPFFAYFAVMSFLVSAHAAAQPTNTPTNLQSLCPSVSLTGPNRVLRGSPVKVVAVIEGETKKDSVKYEWDVSAGSIAAGQGTQELVVDTGELNVDEEEDVTIKVTLRLSGSARECAKTVFHTVTVGGQLAPAILVDRYNHIKESDEKARLDNFAIMLQNQPQCSGHVLVYAGRREPKQAAKAHADRVKSYLVNFRGLETARIITLVGQVKEFTVELWVVPPGAAPPR